MPVNRDPDGRRWVEMEFPLPGTPEQIWEAIATGPGITAWFVPAVVEEHVGGRVEFDLGDGTGSSGVVTAWEPPHRLGYEERDWNGEAPPLATEFTIEAQAGGRCIVRLVHSLFVSDAEWDDQMESFEQGWPGFFGVLRVYLTHFAGRPVAAAGAGVSRPGSFLKLWREMTRGLGLVGADVGERRSAPAGAPRLAGVVEGVRESEGLREVTLRLGEPADGIALLGSYACEGKARAAVSLYFYGEQAAETARDVPGEWEAWLAGLAALDEGRPDPGPALVINDFSST